MIKCVEIFKYLREFFVRAFFVGFLFLGTIFVFTLPPFQVPDESTHWLGAIHRIKAFGATEGKKICSRAFSLPDYLISAPVSFNYSTKVHTGLYEKIRKMKRSCLDRDPIVYGNVGTYFMVAISTFLIDRYDVASRQTLIAFFLARLIAGFCMALVFYRFYRVSQESYGFMPPGTLIAAVFLCSPLFVQQSFGVNADVIVNIMAVSLATIFIAGSRPRYMDLALATTSGIVVAATKPIMAPFMLLLPIAGILLFSRYGEESDRKRYANRRGGSILIGVVMAFASFLFFLKNIGIDSISSTYIGGINAAKQLEYSIANPIEVGTIMVFRVLGMFNVRGLTGPLGWLDTPVSRSVTGWWAVLLFAAIVVEVVFIFVCRRDLRGQSLSPNLLSMRGKALLVDISGLICFFLGLGLSMLAVVFALYLAWTPVGADGVLGVQNRYFFPFFIVLPLILAIFVRPYHFLANSSGVARCSTKSLVSFALVILMALGLMIYSCHVYVDLARRFY